MGIVFGWLGRQKFVQSFKRIVRGTACYACKIVNFPAHTAYSACLFDNAGLLHTAQELHPFHWQNALIGSLAEDREHVKLQGADGSGRRAGTPTFSLVGVPLAS